MARLQTRAIDGSGCRTERRARSEGSWRILASAWMLALNPVLVVGQSESEATRVESETCWRIEARHVSQPVDRQQVWQVDYWLRFEGSAPMVLATECVSAEVEGWVSNARVASHGTARNTVHRMLVLSRGSGVLAARSKSDVLKSSDEARRCAEHGWLELWSEACGEGAECARMQGLTRWATLGMNMTIPLVVLPDSVVRVRLRLGHDHFLYGSFDPLLGERELRLRLGPGELVDQIDLVEPLRRVSHAPGWPAWEPPVDRRDANIYLTAPHSLRLSAHAPGQGYFRTSGPVKYDTRMRLSFWYLLASDAEVEGCARVSQLMQGPAVWKPLHGGQLDIPLSQRGQWVRVDRVIRTQREATTLSIEFRAHGELGELWIDELRLEPLDAVAMEP